MSEPLLADERVDERCAEEERVTLSMVCAPASADPVVRYRADVVRLRRDQGRVTGSSRIAALAVPEAVSGPKRVAEVVADGLLGGLHGYVRRTAGGYGGAAFPRQKELRWQSAAITVARRPEVLVRLESSAGPVLIGGGGTTVDATLRERVAAWLRLLAVPALARHELPAGWRQLPVVLSPPVAAALVIGARLVLGAPGAARLAGRPVLPPITLTDRPLAHDPGERDDAGHPATAWPLVRRGVVVAFPQGPAAGVPAGRARWDHDEQRLLPARAHALQLAPAQGQLDTGRPEVALELLECVERVRRYQTDGRMRLVCVARVRPGGHRFLVGVGGRPLTLLRAVTAVAGEAATIWTDHVVETPALVMPSVASLEGSSDARFTAL
jgi:hypothetical protein